VSEPADASEPLPPDRAAAGRAAAGCPRSFTHTAGQLRGRQVRRLMQPRRQGARSLTGSSVPVGGE
jgi:hypothetical protein